MNDRYIKSARLARIFSLSFGVFFAALTVLCIVDRYGLLSSILGKRFMWKWLSLNTDWSSISQLALMSAGGLGIFGGACLIHHAVARASSPKP